MVFTDFKCLFFRERLKVFVGCAIFHARHADLFDLLRYSGFIPRRKINQNMRIRSDNGRTCRKFFHQLNIAVRAADAVKASQSRQQLLHILVCQYRTVKPVSGHDTDASAGSLQCIQRYTGCRQCINIPADRPSGHFKHLRQFRRRHLFFLKKHR